MKKIEAGDRLAPNLSRAVKLAHDPKGRRDKDRLIADWGLHHLHLSGTVEADGFVQRDDVRPRRDEGCRLPPAPRLLLSACDATVERFSPSNSRGTESPRPGLVIYRHISRLQKRREEALGFVHRCLRPSRIIHAKVPSTHQCIVRIHGAILLRLDALGASGTSVGRLSRYT